MTRQELISLIRERKSFLCVGLDTDPAKMPAHLRDAQDGIFLFNRAIIDATIDHCVAYKPNLAFYEALGIDGLRQLKLTMDYLHQLGKPVFTIADAKRGDIGNTSERYARAFLDPRGDFDFDAITVAPYMGADSVQPFTAVEGKWVILLALTSNKGAFDFQLLPTQSPSDSATQPLYQRVLETSKQWGNEENMMYVVGATKAEMLTDVRRIVPGSFLLVPGVGAQGGSLEEVCKHGLNKDCGLLVNSSRGIIYASNGTDFAEAAAAEARKLQQQMAAVL
jgi:orotidine-5'-phosphate decarboxylase